jgi:hypothetical protein
MRTKAPKRPRAFRLPSKLSLCRLALVVCAVLAVTCQNQSYSLAPTPCDEFCESRQRANCSRDDPEACVAACETNPYITDKGAGTVATGCEALGERLTQCLLQAPPESFYCTNERTGWHRALCAEEQDAVSRCGDFSNTCSLFCGQQAEQCGHDLAWCQKSCRPELPCAPEFSGLYDCLDSGPVACTEDIRQSTRPDCAEQRAVVDTCIAENPEYFRDLPPRGDGGAILERGDASGGLFPSNLDGGE